MKNLISLFAISLSLAKVLTADMANEQIDITTITLQVRRSSQFSNILIF